MEAMNLPLTIVNYCWHIRQQLTASGSTALKCNSSCDFTRFGRKIKINRNLFRILRNFTDTSIKIHIDDVKSLLTFRICLDFFDRNVQNCNWKKKISTLIRNVTKLFTSSICIFLVVSIKFRSISTKSRFILIFWPNHAKSQFFSKC